MKRKKKANCSSYYIILYYTRHDKGLMWYRRGGNFSRRGTEAATSDKGAPRVVNDKISQSPHTTCHCRTGIAGYGEYHSIVIFTNDVRTN